MGSTQIEHRLRQSHLLWAAVVGSQTAHHCPGEGGGGGGGGGEGGERGKGDIKE